MRLKDLPRDLLRIIFEYAAMKDEYNDVMKELFLRTRCLGWMKPIQYNLKKNRCLSCGNMLCHCESVITFSGYEEYEYLCLDCCFKEYLERENSDM